MQHDFKSAKIITVYDIIVGVSFSVGGDYCLVSSS